MFSRVNIFRLLRDEINGIRDHSDLAVSAGSVAPASMNSSAALPRDRSTLLLLIAVPVGIAYVAIRRNWTLSTGADLLAAFSLTAGVLLAVFALIASWRERLANRIKLREVSERLARQRLDEAARHTLTATVFCVVGASLSIVASATVHGNPPRTSSIIAAAAYGVFSIVGLLILMVVLLVHDVFSSTIQGIENEKLAELTPEQQNLLNGAASPSQSGNSP